MIDADKKKYKNVKKISRLSMNYLSEFDTFGANRQ